MRASLTALSVTALLAATASSAAARPDAGLRGGPSSVGSTVAAPSRGVQHHYGIDPAAVRSPRESAPVGTVHVDQAPVSAGGVNWADIGIGAGLATALLLSAAGVSVLRRRLPMTTAERRKASTAEPPASA